MKRLAAMLDPETQLVLGIIALLILVLAVMGMLLGFPETITVLLMLWVGMLLAQWRDDHGGPQVRPGGRCVDPEERTAEGPEDRTAAHR